MAPGFVATVHQISDVSVVGDGHLGQIFYIRPHDGMLSDS